MQVKLKKYQDNFIFSEARYPALVSSIGTGKTLCGIMRMMNLMEKYPDNLGIVVRKEFTDLKDSTIKDFQLYTGLTVGSNKDVVLPNRSLIMFRHGDEINVLKNINAGAILIEQAEEFETDEQFIFLRDRLRRANVGFRTLFLIANTNGHNWIYKLWKVNEAKDQEFFLQEATTFDNADNLPKDYITDLKKMENTHPAHYRRYVLNSWEDTDVVDQIIRPEWIDEALKSEISIGNASRSVVVCDPARYGDDRTVIYAFKGNRIIDKEIYGQKDTMHTVGRMIILANRNGIKNLAVDVCGLGAGIADRLKELGADGDVFNTFEINSASREVSDKDKYKNVRAEMWAKASDKFYNKQVKMYGDTELREELLDCRYKTIESNGRVQVEAKEDIKKRIGKSPDKADCFIMGLYILDKVKSDSLTYSRFENPDDINHISSFKR